MITAEDEVVGTGDLAELGTLIRVEYSTKERQAGSTDELPVVGGTIPGEEIEVPVDGHMLIKGWNDGIMGRTNPPMEPMRVGGTRIIEVPPDDAYRGNDLADLVDDDSTLIFRVTLHGVRDYPYD